MKRQNFERELFDGDGPEDPLYLVPKDVRHLVPDLLERRKEEVSELLDLLKNDDYAAIRDIGHKLKSTGAGYGLNIITDIGRELEVAANSRDAARIHILIQQLSMVTMIFQALLNTRNASH